MADKVIENLVTKLTFDYDEKKLKAFSSNIKKVVKGLTAIVAGATAAAAGMLLFANKIVGVNDELGKLSEKLGIDIKSLQELGYVAELNGGSIDSMNSSLANLTKLASESSRGVGAGVEVFGLLGISAIDAGGAIKSADDLLMEISDSVARLGTQAERLELTQKLGLGSELLLSIQQGSAEILKQRKEARSLGFIISKDDAKQAADFNDELLRIISIVKGVSNVVGISLMKQITPMLQQFTMWFKINQKIIQQNFISYLDKTITVLRAVFSILIRVVGIIDDLAMAMGGWKNSIIAVTALLAIMNAQLLLGPVLSIVAWVAFLAVLEDFITYAKGGDSAFGHLADQFPPLEDVLKVIVYLLKKIKEGWVLIFTEGKNALEGLRFMVQDLGDAIIKFLVRPLNNVLDLINLIPGFNLPNVGGIGGTTRATGGAGGVSNNSTSSSTTNNSTTNNPNLTFNVTTDNPESFTQKVMRILSEQYNGAIQNMQSETGY